MQGEPVYTVKERTVPRENKALRTWAVALFDKAGNKAVNPEIGEVALTAKSLKDSLVHGISSEKALTFEAVPYVIEKNITFASDIKNPLSLGCQRGNVKKSNASL